MQVKWQWHRSAITQVTLLEAAESYFAYEPILKALQASSEASLPLSDILKYKGSSEVRPLHPGSRCQLTAVFHTCTFSCSRHRSVLDCLWCCFLYERMDAEYVMQVGMPAYLADFPLYDLSSLCQVPAAAPGQVTSHPWPTCEQPVKQLARAV